MSDNPWTSIPTLWKHEKAFLNWLRNHVRRVWSRHPVKYTYCRNRITLHPNDAQAQGHTLSDKVGDRTKKVRQCEVCSKWFPISYLEVDHIHGGKGFTNYEGFIEWQHRILFVGYDDIREICKDCHSDINLCQKLGIEMREVPRERARIAFEKLPASDQKRQLRLLKIRMGKNAAERVANYKEYLMEKFK